MKRLNLEGSVFGELKVLSFYGLDYTQHTLWKCQCSCGAIKNIRGFSLVNGTVKSCGRGVHKEGPLHNLIMLELKAADRYFLETGEQWDDLDPTHQRRLIEFERETLGGDQ